MNLRVPKDNHSIDLDIDREEMKALVKQAIKEWMDEGFYHFARWSFGIAATAVFGGIVWAWVSAGFPLHSASR